MLFEQILFSKSSKKSAWTYGVHIFAETKFFQVCVSLHNIQQSIQLGYTHLIVSGSFDSKFVRAAIPVLLSLSPRTHEVT